MNLDLFDRMDAPELSLRVECRFARAYLASTTSQRLASYGVRRQSEAAAALWRLRGIGPTESAVAASLCRRTPNGGTDEIRPVRPAGTASG